MTQNLTSKTNTKDFPTFQSLIAFLTTMCVCVHAHARMCVLYAQVCAQVHLPMYGWGDQRMMLGPVVSTIFL